MSDSRDVQAFDDRSTHYEQGWLGQLHREIVQRTVTMVVEANDSPQRVLDVGCGTGQLLRLCAEHFPEATELTGIDPAPGMVNIAVSMATDPRIAFLTGMAERLPFPAARYDTVVSTTSFDHWKNQAAGLAECARVLAPGGNLVLTDLISAWLAPTLIGKRRDRARTRGRVRQLLTEAGFQTVTWHRGYALILNTAVAHR